MEKTLEDKAIDIHGKKYIMVVDRILEFNKLYKNGSITTFIMPSSDPKRITIKATVIPDVANSDRMFVGHASEVLGSSSINQTSALENCETSAVGRALAFSGIGIIDSIASADEVVNALQNAPKTHQNASGGEIGSKQGKATMKQINYIKRLIKDAGANDKDSALRMLCEVCGTMVLDFNDLTMQEASSAIEKLIKPVPNAEDDAELEIIEETKEAQDNL